MTEDTAAKRPVDAVTKRQMVGLVAKGKHLTRFSFLVSLLVPPSAIILIVLTIMIAHRSSQIHGPQRYRTEE